MNFIEIKGSDLFKKENTKIRKWVTKEILSNARGTFTIWDFYLQKSLDISHEWILGLIKKNVSVTLIEQFLLASCMAETCRAHLFVFNSTKWKKNFNEKKFIDDVFQTVKSKERHIQGFKNTASMMIDKVRSNELNGWSNEINNDDYQVISTVILDVLQMFHSPTEFELDDFPNQQGKVFIKLLTEKIGLGSTVVFADSKNSTGVQIADWLTSICRKTIQELLVKWCYREFKVGDFISNEEIEYGNELLNIWKILSNNFASTYHIQTSYRERAFLICLISLNDIIDVIDEDFMDMVSQEEQSQISRDIGSVFNK